MDELEVKRRAQDHFGVAASENLTPLEGNLFHDYFRLLAFQELDALLRRNHIDLTDKFLHVAGCGRGLDVLYLSRFYRAKFHVTDLSPECVSTTLQTFPGASGQAEDMEHLSYPDNTFDWSFVDAALHHLPRPVQGLHELLRVSREGAIFIEPHDSWLVRAFVALGLAQEYEPVGNYVYRWKEDEVRKLCKSLSYRYAIAKFFQIHRVAKTRIEFELLRKLNQVANALVPQLGSGVVCCIFKSPHVSSDR